MEFRRDRLTWLAYALLGWFAYLQASPGLVVPHLRDELGLSYSVGGLHVAAFAVGSVVAGLTAAPLERHAGRRRLLWLSAAAMTGGTAVLVAGRTGAVTVGAMLVMGTGGGLLLVTIQALLSDHHGPRRAIALTEANVAAGVSYVVLIGGLSLAAVLELGWRAALVAVLALPPLAWWLTRRERIEAPPALAGEHGRLPPLFWIAAAMLFCTTAAEWCVTAWGASFVEGAADLPVDTAVALMSGYFAGVLAGRVIGSRLARRIPAPRLLAAALAVSAAGFALLWPAGAPAPALAGLAIVGLGIGNLFPLGLAVTVGLAPERAQLASGRAVMAGAAAVLLAPLTVGTLADATSLTAAFAVVPAMLALAAAGLTAVVRVARRTAVAGA